MGLQRKLTNLIGRITAASIRSVDEGAMSVRRSGRGTELVDDSPEEFPARITEVGSGSYEGAYGWRQLIGRASGTWIDGPRYGTLSPSVRDPAWEANLDDGLTVGNRIYLYREATSGEMRFQARPCP